MFFDYNLIDANILMIKDTEDEISKSGLITKRSLGDGTPFLKGIVVAIGPGRVQGGIRVPVSVAVGDEIMIFGDDSCAVQIEGNPYILTAESMVICHRVAPKISVEKALQLTHPLEIRRFRDEASTEEMEEYVDKKAFAESAMGKTFASPGGRLVYLAGGKMVGPGNGQVRENSLVQVDPNAELDKYPFLKEYREPIDQSGLINLGDKLSDA